MSVKQALHRSEVVGVIIAAAALLLLLAPSVQAEVKKIVIDTNTSPDFEGNAFGNAGPYETIRGHAFGELDPNDPHNSIIQDINLAPRNANGRVEYIATFQIQKPIDMSRGSGLMWHEVPNRGRRGNINLFDRNNGDTSLSSGWQGDNMGYTSQDSKTNDYVIVPIAKNPDGSSITGPVLGRIFNQSGPDSQPILVYHNPMPYKPATLDTTQATLVTHAAETNAGVVTGVNAIPSTDWAWASCNAMNPFPGTPDATQICLKDGFDPTLLYQIVFTSKDPYVLGIGFAAFRDVGSFFKYETEDDLGTPNPVAGNISWTISRGSSQSGNFVREFIHLGFNADEAGRSVHDGASPRVAGRKLVMNVRFATPDQHLMLNSGGMEGPMWYQSFPDDARGLPLAGILDRCNQTDTCPKILELFGGSEFWYLHMSPGLVGTEANVDIPLPPNVRRYYIPGTRHGGGPGGFSVTPASIPNGPGNGINWGPCTFANNPVPYRETDNALVAQFRDWVVHGTPMVPSQYPTLRDKTLVAPTKTDMGFPTIPAILASSAPEAPDGIINPVKDYDWGPRLNYTDQRGIIDIQPAIIKGLLPTLVPRVDEDGNELGGVPVVLHEVPLGTYLGWNITSDGFFEGQTCSFAGGMIPFAKTKAERLLVGDGRLSLEERYGDHNGYVAAVKAAAADITERGFLLPADAEALIEQAAAGNVLR